MSPQLKHKNKFTTVRKLRRIELAKNLHIFRRNTDRTPNIQASDFPYAQHQGGGRRESSDVVAPESLTATAIGSESEMGLRRKTKRSRVTRSHRQKDVVDDSQEQNADTIDENEANAGERDPVTSNNSTKRDTNDSSQSNEAHSVPCDTNTHDKVSSDAASNPDVSTTTNDILENGGVTEDTESSNNQETKKYRDLFNSLYSAEVVPSLPDKSWAVHCTDTPEKCIVVSEMAVRRASGIGLVPIYLKQIVFDEDMNYEIYLTHSKAVLRKKPSKAKTLIDFNQLLSFINTVKVCVGGPDVNDYLNVNPECAYKDPKGKWRHNLCSLEVTDEDICESCISLEDILQRHAARNRAKSGLMVGVKRKRFS